MHLDADIYLLLCDIKLHKGLMSADALQLPATKASEKTLREPIFAARVAGFFCEAMEKQSNVTAKQ